MSRKPSTFSKIWASLKKTVVIYKQPDVFVGEDQYGNRYFEKRADAEKGLKQQRRVEPSNPDQWEVPNVPVEWMTWLRGGRKTPPSGEEIEYNIASMMKTQHRARELQEQRQETPAAGHAGGTGRFPTYPDYEPLSKQQLHSSEQEVLRTKQQHESSEKSDR